MSATISATPSEDLPPLTRYFSQLAYVVADLDAAVATMRSALGATFSFSEGRGHPSEVRYRGQPHGVRSRLAFADLHGIELEIIQPLSDKNIFTEFLGSHGGGLHHAGFKVPDHDSFIRYRERMIANGIMPIVEGRIEQDRVEFGYFECRAFGASILEITHFF